jgi:urease accessory protein
MTAIARTHRPAGSWPRTEAADTLTLTFDERHRRRIRMRTDRGEAILLDLPKTVAMSDGDGLRLENGRWLEVKAAPEEIVEVRHPDPRQLTRIAWHLGNRHLPTEITVTALRIRPDHVIEALLRGLGAELSRLQTPFQPEGGAYGGHGHHHDPRATPNHHPHPGLDDSHVPHVSDAPHDSHGRIGTGAPHDSHTPHDP